MVELDGGAAVPADRYRQTYDAIPARGAGDRGLRRLRRVARWLFILALLYGGGLTATALLAHRARGPARPADVARPTADQPRPIVRGPEVIGTAPARDKATVHVGDALDFAVSAAGPDLRYGWTLDGRPAGTGPRWTYVPMIEDAGTRRVEVMVVGREGSVARGWRVRVRPGRAPEIVAAEPPVELVEGTAGGALRLALSARAREPGVTVAIGWTVDGAPAGEGRSLTLRPQRAGSVTVRAVATTQTGGSASREWRVAVRPPVETATVETPSERATPAERPTIAEHATPTERPTVSERPAPAERPAASEAPVPAGRPAAPVVTRRPAAPRRAEVYPSSPSSPQEEVRWLLERYAAAWRARDIQALRDLGQISSERAAQALRRYFADLEDFDVEIDLLGLRSEGGRTIVRFVRRDRFRNPSGQMVLQESPPIEKEVVQTPDGLRFAPGRG